MGWAVGWKMSTHSETIPHSFPRTSFWILSELLTRTKPLARQTLRTSEHPCDVGHLSLMTVARLKTTNSVLEHTHIPAKGAQQDTGCDISMRRV